MAGRPLRPASCFASVGPTSSLALVADSLRRLYPDGQLLADALSQAVAQTVQSAQGPETSLAMEVATSLLYLEACWKTVNSITLTSSNACAVWLSALPRSAKD